MESIAALRLGAICVVMASAGLVFGRRVHRWPSIRIALRDGDPWDRTYFLGWLVVLALGGAFVLGAVIAWLG